MAQTVLYRRGRLLADGQPDATAMAVTGGRIGWLGTDEAAAALIAGVDEIVDLDGALVTPAFVDAHVHVTDTGIALIGLDLVSRTSLEDALRAIAEEARRTARGQLVIGHGYDDRAWPERRPPTRIELDQATDGGLAYVSRIDGHSGIVSTALAELVGAKDLAGWDDSGRVERDANAAVVDATSRMCSPEERRRLQVAALKGFAEQGVLTVHEMSAPHIAVREDLAMLVELGARPDLPDVVPYRGELVEDEAQARAVLAELAGLGIAVAGLAGDLNIDGSVGSHTAAFLQPYADRTHDGHCGHLYLSPDQIARHLIACTQAGVQGGFHVIGDAGVKAACDGVQAAADLLGTDTVRAVRHRLEHLEATDAAQADLLSSLGVVASMQPAFDANWGGTEGMYAERLGVDRGPLLNPTGLLARAGAIVAFGSDAPVTPIDPWGGVRAAMFHQHPDLRMDAATAFRSHTRDGHRAANDDRARGIEVGADATFAVWDAGTLVDGLPDLTPGSANPSCRLAVLRGQVVHGC